MAPLLELKLAPSTLTRDLVLRPRDKYYAAALSAGTKMPGMGVIRDIFALAHFCAPSLGVIPKESLIRLTKDLDYVFGLHYLVARYMLNARDYPETALEVKAQFIEGLRDPNTISLRHIIHGYDVFMNNFMMHLPGGHYRELEGAAPLPGEPEPAYEEGVGFCATVTGSKEAQKYARLA